MKKIMLIPVAALAIGAAMFVGTKTVSAHTEQPQSHQTLIQRIVQRFGLKQEDVQKVFDDHHAEMRTQMDAKVEATLAQDVKDGKITEDQKQIIIAKYKELADKKMTAKTKAEMKAEKQELLDWAKQNNLDVKYLLSKVMQLKLHHQKWK